MGELASAAQAAQAAQLAAQSGEDAFRSLLVQRIPAMKKVMPSVVTPERLLQLGMDCYRGNPQLAECPPETIVSALMTCSALGLEPSAVDGLGRAYILPRWNKRTRRKEASFELGYPGAIELMLRSGKVLDVKVRAVYEADEFDYQLGTDEYIRHRPARGARRELTHVYLIAQLAGGARHMEVMDRADIDRRRAASPAKDKGPWVDHYEEMAKKTIVLYAAKWLPKSVELQRAMDADWTVTPEPVPAVREEPVDVDYETGEVG